MKLKQGFINQVLDWAEVLVGKEEEDLKKKLKMLKELGQMVFAFVLNVAIKLVINEAYPAQR